MPSVTVGDGGMHGRRYSTVTITSVAYVRWNPMSTDSLVADTTHATYQFITLFHSLRTGAGGWTTAIS